MVSLNYVTKRITFLQISYRSFCIGISKDLKDNVVRSVIRKPLKEKRAEDVFKYLKDNNAEHLFAKIPHNYMEKSKHWKSLLINPFVGKRIGQALKLYLKEGYVLESDPGLGLVSKELVSFVSSLRLYEEDIDLRINLRKLQKNYASKNIDIFDKSLLRIHKIQFEDNIYNDVQMAVMFDGIRADSKVNLFIALPSKNFISNWIRHLLLGEYFTKFDGLEFYFLIPPSIYTRLMATPRNAYCPRYQAFSVLAQLLFDIELIINDIPRKAFLPWPQRKNSNLKHLEVQKYENDHEVLFLIRMCLRKDFLKNFPKDDLFQCFLHFANEVVRGKKRIIPYFEKLIPGSGARLIVKGYTIYSYFGELTPPEIFSMFMEFSKWPEFKNTSFYTYWKNVASHVDNKASPTNSSSVLSEDICDEDDNDDDIFMPGNKVK